MLFPIEKMPGPFRTWAMAAGVATTLMGRIDDGAEDGPGGGLRNGVVRRATVVSGGDVRGKGGRCWVDFRLVEHAWS